MARGIFDTIAPAEYLELAEANVRFINTKIKKAEDDAGAAGVSLALATLYQAEKGLFEVPRAVDDPFPSRLNG